MPSFHAKYSPPERRTDVLIGKFHSREEAVAAIKEHIVNRGIALLGADDLYELPPLTVQAPGYSIDMKPWRRSKKEVSEEKAREAEAKARQTKLFYQ